MFFIIGLGNPGLKYSTTRHNVGFMAIDYLAEKNNIALDKKRHKAIVGQGVINGEKVILLKPQTYMNLSGESVRDILDFYKEDNESLVVIYDDTSLDVGNIRIREKGSAGGHNGIKSIINHTGSDHFCRIKVGVGNKPPGWDLADYVLSRFEKEEMTDIVESIKKTADAVETILSEGTKTAMNKHNVKNNN